MASKEKTFLLKWLKGVLDGTGADAPIPPQLTEEQRARLAQFIEDVAEGRFPPERILEELQSPRWADFSWKEKFVDNAFHALMHWQIDSDIRARDKDYADDQKQGLVSYARRLRAQ